MAGHDHIRSCNRGPGNIVGEDARKTRQSLSQTQTHSKKRKAKLAVGDTCTEGLVNITKEIAGNGGVKGAYVSKRHKFGPKGRPIPPSKQAKLDGTFGDQAEAAEDLAKLAMPKYNVGPGNDVGTYLSPQKFTYKQSALIGLKGDLRGPISDNRSFRLANLGVNMLNQFQLELHNEYNERWVAAGSVGDAPNAPTNDEIKAAIQQSLILAWENRNQPVALRRGVNKDITDLPTP